MLRRIGLCLALFAAMTFGGVIRGAEPAHAAAAHGNTEANAGDDSLIHKPGTAHHVVEFDIPQVIWVLIIFVILLIILYPTAWKSVLEGLKKREERIRKDIADAEAARAKAEATLKQYQAQLAAAEDKVRELIAGATAQGEKIATEIRMKAQQESEETKQRAVRDIDNARKQALTDIYQRAAEISTSIASKILRRSINADDQRDLVQQGLSELETASK